MSPHLDDAVFSAGAALTNHATAGDEVMVLTCFTGNVERPTGFALGCQFDKGIAPEVDYMALRREEDRAACERIGAIALHGPFLEAPHRGYESAEALFAGIRDGDDITVQLVPALCDVIGDLRPDLIYGPYGVGNHVDHLAVRAALSLIGTDIVWWEDFPYAMRDDHAPPDIQREAVDPEALSCKRAAMLCYESQLGFQFGSRAAAEAALSKWNVEGFARSGVHG